jgi:hypothetical protein
MNKEVKDELKTPLNAKNSVMSFRRSLSSGDYDPANVFSWPRELGDCLSH